MTSNALPIDAVHTEFLRENFPGASDDLLRLLSAARENTNLTDTDFYTMKDLLELSEYVGDEVLSALLLILLLALDEGSLCIEVSEAALARRFDNVVEPVDAQSWSQRIVAALRSHGFPNLIAQGTDKVCGNSEPQEDKPVILCTSGERQLLYFHKFFHHERRLEQLLVERLRRTTPRMPVDGIRASLHTVLNENPLRIDGRPLVLDSRQQEAVTLALERNFTIISGGPGTGKTSIVVTLVRCLARLGMPAHRIVLAAPTGRAAQRLTDAIRNGLQSLAPAAESSADSALADMQAYTIHRMLEYNPARGTFGRHAENPVAADAIIVDEVSMVSLVLMSQLLQAANADCKLIFLGDKDQLPSVDAGAVLASLIQDQASSPLRDSIVVLEQNYRSEPRIRDSACAINNQDIEVVNRLPVMQLRVRESANGDPASLPEVAAHGGCWLLPQSANEAQLHYILEQWVDLHYLRPWRDQSSYGDLVLRCERKKISPDCDAAQKRDLDQLFAALNRSRVLTLVRESAWGCNGINRFVHQYLARKLDRRGIGELFSGAPVLITLNDPAKQIYNGDVGIALRGPGGGLQAVFSRQGGYVAFPVDMLLAHELGFSLTVHKSQGSEYSHVIFVLPPSGGRGLLTKEMIYTAITRAKNLAVMYGSKDVLRFAIGRKISRESGLWLQHDGIASTS
jgi:exodeoxyribonuclease V alpha subunit